MSNVVAAVVVSSAVVVINAVVSAVARPVYCVVSYYRGKKPHASPPSS